MPAGFMLAGFKQLWKYYGPGIASGRQADAICALTRWQLFFAWNIMAV